MSPDVTTDTDMLPELPVAQGDALALMRQFPDRLHALREGGRRRYGPMAMRIGDRLGRRWLERTGSPYTAEVAAVAASLGAPGGWILNLSYEWGCTVGLGPDPAGEGCRMLRTLDWPLDGLGRNLVAAWQGGPAGRYLNLTWPGFVGAVQAMAPGRFVVALNQAPFRGGALPGPLGWGSGRLRLWRQRAIPPLHLLRLVLDRARSYDEARTMLRETPLAMPALLSLTGTGAEQCCVIERLERRAVMHDGPGAVANHWLSAGLAGAPRTVNSPERREAMLARRTVPDDGEGFAWLQPPIRNAGTRLALSANAATGRLYAQAWESDGPASRVLQVDAGR